MKSKKKEKNDDAVHSNSIESLLVISLIDLSLASNPSAYLSLPRGAPEFATQ